MKQKIVKIGLITKKEFEDTIGKKIYSNILVIKEKGNADVLICNTQQYVIAINYRTQKLIYIHYKNIANLYETIIGAVSLYGVNYFSDMVESANVNGSDKKEIEDLVDSTVYAYSQLIVPREKENKNEYVSKNQKL